MFFWAPFKSFTFIFQNVISGLQCNKKKINIEKENFVRKSKQNIIKTKE